MGFGDRIRRLFSRSGREEEAAQREEYGAPDRGEAELARDDFGFAQAEGSQAAREELAEFEPPRDPAP